MYLPVHPLQSPLGEVRGEGVVRVRVGRVDLVGLLLDQGDRGGGVPVAAVVVQQAAAALEWMLLSLLLF